MKRKMFLIPLALLLTVSTLAIGCPPVQVDPDVDPPVEPPPVIRWDLSIQWPPGNFHTEGVVKFAQLVYERTGGRLDITVHPGGALGFAFPEKLAVVRDGLVPIAESLHGGLVGDEPIFGLHSMPFLARSLGEAHLLATIARPFFDEAVARWNQRILYTVPWPRSGIFTKRPIHAFEDLAGLVTRGYDVNCARFTELTGGAPLVIPWGEVYAALAAGLMDSVITSTVSGVDGRLWEVTPYFHRLEFAHPVNMVTVNLDAWNALPGDLRAIVLDVAREVEDRQWLTSKVEDLTNQARLIEEGITVTLPSPELLAQYEEVGRKIWDIWLAEAGPDGEAIIEEFLTLVGR
jgi:TRAP-type C4-dicarboxylate transport system substrate-binding protein